MEYFINDQKLLNALWNNGISCVPEQDYFFHVDLCLLHGEVEYLPDGTRVVVYGAGLHLVGRVFPYDDTPDEWYRARYSIHDPKLPALLREAGYLCECLDIKEKMYEVNFYVEEKRPKMLTPSLWVTYHRRKGLERC